MNVKKTIADLKAAATRASEDARRHQAEIDGLQRSCCHNWGEIKYVPICTEGYTAPGDPPGTMGIDWRGPTYVPPTTTPQWERTCLLCDLTQKTQSTKEQCVAGPIAGTSGKMKVPDFGDR